MFSKILAPIQDPVSDRAVFNNALALAKQNQATLMLLHVFSPEAENSLALPDDNLYRYPIITDELMKNYQQRWESIENQGLEMLQKLAKEAETDGVTVEFSQNMGSVNRVICNMAKNWGADLIVIRCPDRSKLDEFFLGSISSYVLHHAPCPVLAVP